MLTPILQDKVSKAKTKGKTESEDENWRVTESNLYVCSPFVDGSMPECLTVVLHQKHPRQEWMR